MPYKDIEKRREAVRKSRRKDAEIPTVEIPICEIPEIPLPDGRDGITITKGRAVKLLKICQSLDRTIVGLDGQRENMLDLVRYGGITMRSVRECLTG